MLCNDLLCIFLNITAISLQQVVEAASGAGVYAAVHLLGKVQPKACKVGVVLCGGNVDLDALPWVRTSFSYE